MIYSTMENILEFLEENMKKRGWSQADLARKSGLDTSLVSNIFSGRRNIGVTSAIAIAKAFNLPPELVFRKAGLLPPATRAVAEEEQLLHLFRQMTDRDRETFLNYASFLANQ